MSVPLRLQKFIKTMEKVYGSFESPSIEPSTWNPLPLEEGHRGRYLWTDGFGVCNFITLYKETGNNSKYLKFADRLISTVHDILGKTRDGKSRLPGSTEEDPIFGGLRIGKEDEEGTEDGDGQYFHYLTVWMFALNRMSKATNELKYNNWAISMAKNIHDKFTINRDSKRPKMRWKMSIDLSKPWVNSEGNLDPIDGYVMYRLLQESNPSNKLILSKEVEDYKKIVDIKWKSYSSTDPLDLGMTLWTTHWLIEENWAKHLTKSAFTDLDELFDAGEYFSYSARYRLAFREYGTAIGIQSHHNENSSDNNSKEWNKRAKDIVKYWEENEDKYGKAIGPIMYCSALIPGIFCRNYLDIESGTPSNKTST